MRFLPLILIGLLGGSGLSGCRDREEAALVTLNERDYGFDVTDFHRAANQGDAEAVQEFLRAGMAIDVEDAAGQTAFQVAAAADQDAVVRLLVEAGAHPDQRLAEGRTFLMEVAGRTGTDLRMLNFLLEHHADPKAMDGTGLTPLMVAAMAGNVDAVRRLAPHDIRSLDKALMLSAASGHTHCVEALVDRGAYVNCRSHDEWTPLMYASAKGHREAVLLLLNHGANRFAADKENRSAADLAEEGGHPALALLLRDTSTLVSAGTRALEDPLPSLDGQEIALYQDAEGSSGHHQNPDETPVEPSRPQVEGVATPDASSLASSSQVGPPVLPDSATLGTAPDSSPTTPHPPTSGTSDAPNEEAPPADIATASTPSPSLSTPPLDLNEEILLGPFREAFEPLLVTAVEGKEATLQLLHRPPGEALVTVTVGDTIPDTPYEVTAITKRIRPAKGGGTVDLSEVTARRPGDDQEHHFLHGSLPRAGSTHLVVELRRSGQRYAVRPGDRFSLRENGDRYRVADVRPHQLVLRDETTGEVVTLQRGGGPPTDDLSDNP